MNEFIAYMDEIKKACQAKEPEKRREELKKEWLNKENFLYGAGTLSGFVKKHLDKYDVKIGGFADTFLSGVHKLTGLPIISAKELKAEHDDAAVIVTSELHGKSILKTLADVDFKGKIYNFDELLCFYVIPYDEFLPHIEGYSWAYDTYTDQISRKVLMDSVKSRLLGAEMTPSMRPQYFEPDIFTLNRDEVFVDGGCFIGDTAEEFIRQTKGHYRHIYGFEPDENNIKKAKANLSAYPNIDIAKGGLWHMNNTLRFVSGAFGNSRLSEEGDEIAATYGIDDFFSDKEEVPTFIKMDIEGAEHMAIDGAGNTLKNHAPKLAICVYHKLEDMYDIPKRILYYNPNYKFTLRHYSHWYAESVCYGVCK